MSDVPVNAAIQIELICPDGAQPNASWSEAAAAEIHGRIPERVRDRWANHRLDVSAQGHREADELESLLAGQVDSVLNPARVTDFGEGAAAMSLKTASSCGKRYYYVDNTVICVHTFRLELGGQPWQVENPEQPGELASLGLNISWPFPL